jgi:hypothetical protein
MRVRSGGRNLPVPKNLEESSFRSKESSGEELQKSLARHALRRQSPQRRRSLPLRLDEHSRRRLTPRLEAGHGAARETGKATSGEVVPGQKRPAS